MKIARPLQRVGIGQVNGSRQCFDIQRAVVAEDSEQGTQIIGETVSSSAMPMSPLSK